MAQLFSKTFATGLTDATGYDATVASNGTIAQSAGAGLNGTTGGVTCARTANTPNVYGYIDTDLSSLSVIRHAWYTDLSAFTIGTDGDNSILIRMIGVSGTACIVYLYRASGALRHALRLYNDSAVATTDAAVFGLPEWYELRLVRASGVGVSDGQGQVYIGGGDYAPLGELLLEVTGIPNYTVFGQAFRQIAGMHNGLALPGASVGGSLKFDEWTMRDDDVPILYGVSESVISRGMKYVLNRRRRKSYCW